jgi:tight adherence protein B
VIAPGSDKLRQVPFTVQEGGKAVTATQTGGGAPAAIGIAIDVSRSMAGPPLAAAKQAATSFLNGKRAADSMAIYSFGHEANPVHGLDTDINALASSMNQVTLDTVQGTALYDSVIQASSELGTAPTLTKVLVVLTDGDDTTSTKLGAAVKAAKAGNVAIDAIAIGTGNHAALKSLARQTGGHVFAADRSAAGIASVYKQIGAEIRNTYRLQYHSTADGVVPITVSLKGYTAATQKMDLTAPAAEIVAAGGTISKISKHSSSGLALAIVIGLLVLGLVLLMVRIPRETVLARRLDRYTTGERVHVSSQERPKGLSLRNLLVLRGERSFGGSSYFRRVAKLLERADMPMRAAEFVAIQGGLILLFVIIGFVLGLGIVFPLVFAVIGAVLPEFVVRRKANARRKRFEDQLGDTLTAVASSLRAGQSFQQAMSTISMDGPEPISTEFQRVETETRLGRPADEALQSMAERLGSKNFEFVVLAVNIQRQVGGSLSEILDMVADTVRGRVQFARKVRALTAMGRASAYVLVGMPFALAVMISLVDRSYLRPLWATSAGHLMIIIGLISMTFGGIVTRKIVNFKY